MPVGEVVFWAISDRRFRHVLATATIAKRLAYSCGRATQKSWKPQKLMLTPSEAKRLKRQTLYRLSAISPASRERPFSWA